MSSCWLVAGKIDFDGMALAGLALIKKCAWARKALQAKYPILVVDEYQDLGVPLHQIVLHLCFDAGMRLFAVGDTGSIHLWLQRGAPCIDERPRKS